jgi:hypothetical protein
MNPTLQLPALPPPDLVKHLSQENQSLPDLF